MTLDDLLNKKPRHCGLKPLRSVPDLGLKHQGRKLTPEQTENLLRNVGMSYAPEALPEKWRGIVGHALVDLFVAHQPWPALLVQAIEYGDPACFARVKELVANHSDCQGWTPLGFATRLLREEGAAALPSILARRRKSGYDPLGQELKMLRQQNVVRPLLFEMIARPQPETQWRELREGGEWLTVGEFRACLSVDKHAKHAAALEFEIADRSGRTRRERLPFELAEGDRVQVALPEAPATDWEAIRLTPTMLFLRLEARGWRRGPVDDKGLIRWHERAFPALGVRAVVEYDGVPAASGAGNWQVQRIRDLRYEPAAHTIAEAEVATDLAGLAASR